MARKLRDRRLIVVLAVALIYHIEAAVTIEAATHLYRVSDSPFQVDIASSVNSSLAQAEDQAADLAASWNLTSPFAFAQLAEPSTSLVELLGSLHAYPSVVVILPGTVPPVRPDKATAVQYLTLANDATTQAALGALPISSINQAAAASSSLMDLTLYPLKLKATMLNSTSPGGPWAVYDVPAGVVYLDVRMLENFHLLPVNMFEYASGFAAQLFRRLSDVPQSAIQQAANSTVLGQIFSSAAGATAMALTSQVPLWYCFTCPIVLGLLFPYIFNLGLGEVADQLCQIYSLPNEQCNELWYSAFALAMILSFASVLPIISICRLAQCARPASPSLA